MVNIYYMKKAFMRIWLREYLFDINDTTKALVINIHRVGPGQAGTQVEEISY